MASFSPIGGLQWLCAAERQDEPGRSLNGVSDTNTGPPPEPPPEVAGGWAVKGPRAHSRTSRGVFAWKTWHCRAQGPLLNTSPRQSLNPWAVCWTHWTR